MLSQELYYVMQQLLVVFKIRKKLLLHLPIINLLNTAIRSSKFNLKSECINFVNR